MLCPLGVHKTTTHLAAAELKAEAKNIDVNWAKSLAKLAQDHEEQLQNLVALMDF